MPSENTSILAEVTYAHSASLKTLNAAAGQKVDSLFLISKSLR